MRELLIKIRAILEGAGLKDAASQQRDVAQATRDATKAAEQQARTTTSQATPADQAAAKAKDAVATATKKSASTMEDLKRAGGPATTILQGFSQAAAGGVQSVTGLTNVGKGLVAALVGGFGPAGILATAAGVVGGLAVAAAKKFSEELEPAVDAGNEKLKEFAATAGEIEQLTLETYIAQVAKLNRELDATIEKSKFALEQNKLVEDANTAANIATVRAQVKAGQISETAGSEAIRGFELAQQLRNTRAPAERAAIEQQAAEGRAAIDAKIAADLSSRFQSTIGELNEYNLQLIEARRLLQEATNKQAREVGSENPFNIIPSAEMSVLAEQIKSDEKAIAETNARLIKAGKALAEAREKAAQSEKDAAAARERAAAVATTAAKVGALQTQSAIIEQSAERTTAASGGVAPIVALEQQRRKQADREIADEIERRKKAPIPNFELPAEASKPGSGFDVRAFNQEQAARFRSGADLKEAEAARRRSFDEAMKSGTPAVTTPERTTPGLTPAQRREQEIQQRRENRFDSIDTSKSREAAEGKPTSDAKAIGDEVANALGKYFRMIG